jgi:hypothetical protein
MQKLTFALLIGIIALAPAIAAAQTAGTGGGKTGGSSSTSSGASGGTTSSGGSSSTPAASPSGRSADLSKAMTKAECEKAGGMWQAADKKCEKKK